MSQNEDITGHGTGSTQQDQAFEHFPKKPLLETESAHPGFGSAELAGIDRILEMLAGPEVAVGKISRLITQQIANLIEEMESEPPEDPLVPYAERLKGCTERLKAYRALQDTLNERNRLLRDTLDMDGPKFTLAFKTLVNFCALALTEAVKPDLVDRVMLAFGDFFKMNDEQLRRDVQKTR